jgi:hypothetical protein
VLVALKSGRGASAKSAMKLLTSSFG